MYDIEIISAPSILGLKPSGVEELGTRLLAHGLKENLHCRHPVVHVPTLNHLYDTTRDPGTNCLNAKAIKGFSLKLCDAVSTTINRGRFAVVLGGDCSILLGVMPALKAKREHGLIFLDAHADFYEPGKSVTGEVADMDLAIITGRGPEMLTDINNLAPYVKDENLVHIGQRDWEETRKYGSPDIRETGITCFSLTTIESLGIGETAMQVLEKIHQPKPGEFWIHFDTDVLADEINPAVDYRLPGGLQIEAVEYLLHKVLITGKIAGISISIYNPKLDKDGQAGLKIVESLGRSFDFNLK